MKRQYNAQSRFSQARGFFNPSKTDNSTETDTKAKTDTSTNSRTEADTNTDRKIDTEYRIISIHVSRDLGRPTRRWEDNIKVGGVVGTGWSWLRIGTGGGHL